MVMLTVATRLVATPALVVVDTLEPAKLVKVFYQWHRIALFTFLVSVVSVYSKLGFINPLLYNLLL